MLTQESLVQRYLGTKVADSLGNPKELLSKFENEVRDLEIPEGQIEEARRVIRKAIEESSKLIQSGTHRFKMEDLSPGYSKASDLAFAAYFRATKGNERLSDTGQKLFLSLLQSYSLPPAIRKKAEMASRQYLKVSKPRLKARGDERDLEKFDLYEKFITTVKAHLQVAKEAVAKGKEHSEEGEAATKLKAGAFTLVNTGGFPGSVMQNLADVVQKAGALINSAGLGKVCYGEVQVTNQVHKSKVLAFYDIASDEMFVRANAKGGDLLETVLHELGHRYQHKVLGSSKDRDVEHLYYLVSGQESTRTRSLKDQKPTPGTEFKFKTKTYRVKGTEYSRGGYKVILEVVGKPGQGASIPLQNYLELQGSGRDVDTNPNYKGFVSNYAKTSPAENFAEMFMFYCMGRLPVLQSVEFERLVFGDSKTAGERTRVRVASRWILEV